MNLGWEGARRLDGDGFLCLVVSRLAVYCR